MFVHVADWVGWLDWSSIALACFFHLLICKRYHAAHTYFVSPKSSIFATLTFGNAFGERKKIKVIAQMRTTYNYVLLLVQNPQQGCIFRLRNCKPIERIAECKWRNDWIWKIINSKWRNWCAKITLKQKVHNFNVTTIPKKLEKVSLF